MNNEIWEIIAIIIGITICASLLISRITANTKLLIENGYSQEQLQGTTTVRWVKK